MPSFRQVADEQVIASSLAAILQQHGYSTTSFTSPLKALAAARSRAPDLLISDLVMRGISGVDLADEVKGQYPECKVLLFSGQAISRPEGGTKACYEYQLLKQEFESALREEALCDCGGANRYSGKAKAVSATARECLFPKCRFKAYRPRAWPCSSGGKLSIRMACAMGCNAPPPAPFIARASSTRGKGGCDTAGKRGHAEHHDRSHEERLRPNFSANQLLATKKTALATRYKRHKKESVLHLGDPIFSRMSPSTQRKLAPAKVSLCPRCETKFVQQG
jgi:CheY-like chemotaxis protein